MESNKTIEELELPQDQKTIQESEAILQFIAQAWVDDRAREVDDGRFEYTVPLADLRTDNGEWKIHSTISSHHVDDELKLHENTPEKAKSWSGPFEIKLLKWTSNDS
jgi:hypothetical protein